MTDPVECIIMLRISGITRVILFHELGHCSLTVRVSIATKGK